MNAQRRFDDGPAWVGVDVGTQGVRTMVVHDDGTVLASGSANLASHRPNSERHEQSPDQWWEAIGVASRQAFASLAPGAAGQVAGLAICSTSGTVVLTDGDGNPRSPALMYDDVRGTAELAEIRQSFNEGVDGSGQDSSAYPGVSQIQLSWALPKIAWLLRHAEKRGFAEGLRICHSADFIAQRLTGQPVDTDTSHALKSGYDLAGRCWNKQLLAAGEIPVEALPQVRVPGTTLGTVTVQAADHTSIPAGTPVMAGMTDGCAAQIAAGALTPGSWNAVLGTTLVLKGVSTELLVDPGGAVYSHRHPDGGWLPGGASNIGARAVSEGFAGHDLDALTEAARAFEPADSLIYPLTVRGERFPFVSREAAGFETGNLTNPAERLAATLQGVAFIERLCFERLAGIGGRIDGQITITGGGARNQYWNQLRADVLGRTLRVPVAAEPAFGMAVLASTGERRLADRATQMVRTAQMFEPRLGAHERFSEPYHQLTAELHARGYLERVDEPAHGGPR